MKATTLTEDEEDFLRKQLYTIFDLDFDELLLLKCIVNGMSLTEFANKFNDFIRYHNKKKTGEMTRFCSFQIRKRMMKKIGKIGLITKGQKKELKEPNNTQG